MFAGYDCSLRTCPFGDDPGTYDDHAEVQLIQCKADSGYFRLTFRQFTTGRIYNNATSYQVKNALQSLKSLSKVNVYFSQDGQPPPGVLNYTKPSKFGFPIQFHYETPTNPTIGKVAVLCFKYTFNYLKLLSNLCCYIYTACDNQGLQIMIVQFVATPGNVPNLHADTSKLVLTFGGSGFPGKLFWIFDGLNITNMYM